MRASRSQWNTCSNFRIDHDHKPEAQAKGVRKCLSFNALRLRFRLVASDFFPGIVCIRDASQKSSTPTIKHLIEITHDTFKKTPRPGTHTPVGTPPRAKVSTHAPLRGK